MSFIYVKEYEDTTYKDNGEHCDMILNRYNGSVSRRSEYRGLAFS